MQIEGALIKEQGVTFAIVVVKPHVIQNSSVREDFRNSCSQFFPNAPIIFMSQNSRGIPTYNGRTDIVKFLANVDISRIPFKRYTFV